MAGTVMPAAERQARGGDAGERRQEEGGGEHHRVLQLEEEVELLRRQNGQLLAIVKAQQAELDYFKQQGAKGAAATGSKSSLVAGDAQTLDLPLTLPLPLPSPRARKSMVPAQSGGHGADGAPLKGESSNRERISFIFDDYLFSGNGTSVEHVDVGSPRPATSTTTTPAVPEAKDAAAPVLSSLRSIEQISVPSQPPLDGGKGAKSAAAPATAASLPPAALAGATSEKPALRVKVLRTCIQPADHKKQIITFHLGVTTGFSDEHWLLEKEYRQILALGERTLEKLRPPKLFSSYSPLKNEHFKRELEVYVQKVVDAGSADMKDEERAKAVTLFLSSDIVTGQNAFEIKDAEIMQQGYLAKRNKNVGGFKFRYFVLKMGVLEYFDAVSCPFFPDSRLAVAQIVYIKQPGGKVISSIPLDDRTLIQPYPQGISSHSVTGSGHESESETEASEYVHAFIVTTLPLPRGAQQMSKSSNSSQSNLHLRPPVSSQQSFSGKGKEPKDARSLTRVNSFGAAGHGPSAAPSQTKRHVLCSENVAEQRLWIQNLNRAISRGGSGSAAAMRAVNGSNSNGRSDSSLASTPASSTPNIASGLASTQGSQFLASTSASAHGSHGNMAKGASGAKQDAQSVARKKTFKSKILGMKNDFLELANPGGHGTGNGGNGSGPHSQFGPSSPGHGGSGTSSATFQRNIFKEPLDAVVGRFGGSYWGGWRIPLVLIRCFEILETKEALMEEGLYRLSGRSQQIKELEEFFERTRGELALIPHFLHLYSPKDSLDVHAVAGILKLYLRNLPQPILTPQLLPYFSSGNVAEHPQRLLQLVLRLPEPNYATLLCLTRHLRNVLAFEEHNKMGTVNLTIVFSISLQIPAEVFNAMLNHWEVIFGKESSPRCRPGMGPMDWKPPAPPSVAADDVEAGSHRSSSSSSSSNGDGHHDNININSDKEQEDDEGEAGMALSDEEVEARSRPTQASSKNNYASGRSTNSGSKSSSRSSESSTSSRDGSAEQAVPSSRHAARSKYEFRSLPNLHFGDPLSMSPLDPAATPGENAIAAVAAPASAAATAAVSSPAEPSSPSPNRPHALPRKAKSEPSVHGHNAPTATRGTSNDSDNKGEKGKMTGAGADAQRDDVASVPQEDAAGGFGRGAKGQAKVDSVLLDAFNAGEAMNSDFKYY